MITRNFKNMVLDIFRIKIIADGKEERGRVQMMDRIA
jgi:hypothetical protein